MSSRGFLLYQAPDGQARNQPRMQDGSVSLTQRQLAERYQVSVPTVNGHLRGAYQDGERLVDLYKLQAIAQVGYRVRSHRGAPFRRWATNRLKDCLVKGCVLDDERFKAGKDDACFEELLARIGDTRACEKLFWRKVLDIHATSIDHGAAAEASQRFFATVQNKLHWAAHGHTAAQRIAMRADARAPDMGLPPARRWPTWHRPKPKRSSMHSGGNSSRCPRAQSRISRHPSPSLSSTSRQAARGHGCRQRRQPIRGEQLHESRQCRWFRVGSALVGRYSHQPWTSGPHLGHSIMLASAANARAKNARLGAPRWLPLDQERSPWT